MLGRIRWGLDNPANCAGVHHRIRCASLQALFLLLARFEKISRLSSSSRSSSGLAPSAFCFPMNSLKNSSNAFSDSVCFFFIGRILRRRPKIQFSTQALRIRTLVPFSVWSRTKSQLQTCPPYSALRRLLSLLFALRVCRCLLRTCSPYLRRTPCTRFGLALLIRR